MNAINSILNFFSEHHKSLKLCQSIEACAQIDSHNTRSAELARLDTMMLMQDELVRQMSLRPKHKHEQVYFQSPAKSASCKKSVCISIFSINCLQIDGVDPGISKADRGRLAVKQAYLKQLKQNMRAGRFEAIFARVRQALPDQNLYPEIALTYAVVYEHLEFFERSRFWVDLLAGRFPLDEYLVVKQAQILTKLGAWSELKAHLDGARGRVTGEHFRQKLMVIRGEHFAGVGQSQSALKTWSLLEKNGYREAVLLINLAHLYLFAIGDQMLGYGYFERVAETVGGQSLRIQDPFYFYRFEECRAHLQAHSTFGRSSLFRSLSKSAQVGAPGPADKAPRDDIYASKRNEFNRSFANKADQLELYHSDRRKEGALDELTASSAEAKDFFVGFMGECTSTYLVGVLVAQSNLELAFKDSLTVTFVTFLLKRVPVVGSSLADVLRKFVQARLRGVMRTRARQMTRFAATLSRFEQRSGHVVRDVMLDRAFLELLSASIGGVHAGYLEKFAVLADKMSFFEPVRSKAEMLGKALAEIYFSNFVFQPKGESVSNPNIVSFLRNCLEFSHLDSSLPPQTIIDSARYSRFYSGFLSMAELVFDAAESCLLSTSAEDGQRVLLKRLRELELRQSVDYVARATEVSQLLGSRARVMKTVQATFRRSLGAEGRVSSNLLDIVKNVRRLKFGTRKFAKSVDGYWQANALRPHAPFKDLFGKQTDYEVKVGALCAFLAIGGVRAEAGGDAELSLLLIRSLNQLSFERKGFFSRFKQVYKFEKNREFEQSIQP